jgi:hypothetical protein
MVSQKIIHLENFNFTEFNLIRPLENVGIEFRGEVTHGFVSDTSNSSFDFVKLLEVDKTKKIWKKTYCLNNEKMVETSFQSIHENSENPNERKAYREYIKYFGGRQ